MKKYDIILFDLDGTISDSKEGITKCVQYALEKFGIIEDDLDKLEHFIGPPLKAELIKSYGFSEEDADKAVSIYRERYEPIGIYETKMYPGIEKLISSLKEKGKLIGLATSKPQEMAEEVLRYFDIAEYFDYVMGAEKKGPRQSKTDVLLELFNQMDLKEKSAAVLIGDTIFDVCGAKNAGIDSIGVSYGYGNVNDMIAEGAICVADSAEELLKLLDE